MEEINFTNNLSERDGVACSLRVSDLVCTCVRTSHSFGSCISGRFWLVRTCSFGPREQNDPKKQLLSKFGAICRCS